MAARAVGVGAVQDLGEVGAVAPQPSLARRHGGPHPFGPGVAGEGGPQPDDHLLGGGQDLQLSGGPAGDPQRQQGRTEQVVRERGPGHGGGARRVPLGLDGAAPGVPEGGGEQGAVPCGEPFADDAEPGFGLHGEVQADGAARSVDGAADAEPAPALRVGPGALGNEVGGVREHLVERVARAEPGQRLVRPQGGGLAAAAGPGEEGHGTERVHGGAVSGERGEAQFGDGGPGVGPGSRCLRRDRAPCLGDGGTGPGSAREGSGRPGGGRGGGTGLRDAEPGGRRGAGRNGAAGNGKGGGGKGRRTGAGTGTGRSDGVGAGYEVGGAVLRRAGGRGAAGEVHVRTVRSPFPGEPLRRADLPTIGGRRRSGPPRPPPRPRPPRPPRPRPPCPRGRAGRRSGRRGASRCRARRRRRC